MNYLREQKQTMDKQTIHHKIYEYGIPLLLFLVPFNFVVTNVFVLIVSANWLIEMDFKNKCIRAAKSPYILCALALFALICIELMFTHNHKAGLFSIEKKLSLLCFPLIIGTSKFFEEKDIKHQCYRFFYLGTLAAAVILISMACYNYINTHDKAYFFYHPLVTPFKQHAVYFSVYIYISMVFLYYDYYLLNKLKTYHVAGILFLSVFLILLSSKLIIVLFLIHAGILILKKLATHEKKLYTYLGLSVIIIAGSLLFLTKNPVRERFKDLGAGNIELLSQSKFNTADYFNAWQLRILLWKFSVEIVSEQHKWLTGVTPGDSQDLLNAKVKQYGMYIGEKQRGDYGYLHHNCHNQYVETLFQTGILGLLLLISILVISFKKVWEQKDRISFFMIFAFSYFFLTESPIERMMGIVPLFILLSLINVKMQPKE